MIQKPAEPADPQATIRRSVEELQNKTRHHMEAWGLGSTDRWDANLDLGTIKFSNADGFSVVADIQVVGSFNADDSTWLWAWANPSVPEALTHAAQLARKFGEKHGLQQYVESKIVCSEDDAWQFTALAMHLSGDAGAYRGPDGSRFIYMVFDEVELRQIN